MMKRKFILIVLFLFYSCQQKVDKQENKQTESEKVVEKEEAVAKGSIQKDFIQLIEEIMVVIENSARQKKATEYGGGDVYGVKVYHYNQDSTLLKVVDDRSSGDYGFSKQKFYLKQGVLIYTERLTAEIDFGQEGATSNYNITFEKNYFPAAHQGLRLIQQKVVGQQTDTGFDKEAIRRVPLTEKDSEKENNLLKQIETYQLLDEN